MEPGPATLTAAAALEIEGVTPLPTIVPEPIGATTATEAVLGNDGGGRSLCTSLGDTVPRVGLPNARMCLPAANTIGPGCPLLTPPPKIPELIVRSSTLDAARDCSGGLAAGAGVPPPDPPLGVNGILTSNWAVMPPALGVSTFPLLPRDAAPPPVPTLDATATAAEVEARCASSCRVPKLPWPTGVVGVGCCRIGVLCDAPMRDDEECVCCDCTIAAIAEVATDTGVVGCCDVEDPLPPGGKDTIGDDLGVGEARAPPRAASCPLNGKRPGWLPNELGSA